MVQQAADAVMRAYADGLTRQSVQLFLVQKSSTFSASEEIGHGVPAEQGHRSWPRRPTLGRPTHGPGLYEGAPDPRWRALTRGAREPLRPCGHHLGGRGHPALPRLGESQAGRRRGLPGRSEVRAARRATATRPHVKGFWKSTFNHVLII